MTTKHFAVFDADSHVVELPALWEKYLEPEYRALGRHALWRQEGRTGAYLKVNGEIFRDSGNPNLPRHALRRPGMSWVAIGELDPHTRHPMTEGASGPQARLADMDAMGSACGPIAHWGGQLPRECDRERRLGRHSSAAPSTAAPQKLSSQDRGRPSHGLNPRSERPNRVC
jgi:hypothetical protein